MSPHEYAILKDRELARPEPSAALVRSRASILEDGHSGAVRGTVRGLRVAGPCAGAASSVQDSKRAEAGADEGQAEYRFVDEMGTEYRYRVELAGSVTIVDIEAHGEVVRVPARMGGRDVVAIGEEAAASAGRSGARHAAKRPGERVLDPPLALKRFSLGGLAASRNTQVVRVVLPEGVERVGRGAFRGCLALKSVELPRSLEELDDLAFSCTGLQSLDIPARCTKLSPLALRLGPESLRCAESTFVSSLRSVGVAVGNECFRMVGPVLCRRAAAGDTGGRGEAEPLEAVLCPAHAEEVRLSGPVRRVAEGAFAGTQHIGRLAVQEGLQLAPGNGLVADATCDRVAIVAPGAPADTSSGWKASGAAAGLITEVRMPAGPLGRSILGALKGCATFRATAFLRAYDETLPHMQDRLEQARLMLARLAGPLPPEDGTRRVFAEILHSELEALCIHFGARNYLEGFDHLVDVGLLDEAGIARIVDVLSARSDAVAVGRLLALKQARFGKAGWDYDL